jgi:methionyl-tRNA synthetase
MSRTKDAMDGRGGKKWWYGIAVAAMFCIFFIGMDVYQNHAVTWSAWVVGAFLFFGVGFSLLNRFGRET